VQSALVYFYLPNCTSILGVSFTAANGTFTSPVLDAGDKKVRVIPPDSAGLLERWNPAASDCASSTAVNFAAGATTTGINVALPPGSAPGGHKVEGKLTDSGTGNQLGFGLVQLIKGGIPYYGFADACGRYSIAGLADGTYDANVFASEHRSQTFTGAVVVAGADVVKDFSLAALSGGIKGRVMSGGLPVQGASVCTSIGFCDQADSSGFYSIFPLDTGLYKLICYVSDHLEPLFSNDKHSLATANEVAVTNGSITPNIDFDLSSIVDGTGEPDDILPGGGLLRPEKEYPQRLQPDLALNRAFLDIEDSDWYSFTATSGKVYRLTITGGGFTLYGAYVGVFDGVTHASDIVASSFITSASGWTATASGLMWIGLSSAFAGSYTVTLTESAPGPPPPTLASINPTSGPAGGGTTVTLTGTNFVAGTTVKFGTQNATNVVIVNTTTITCKSPALAAGGTLYDVTVTTPASAVVAGEVSPHAPDAAATLTKGWFADFTDVATAFIYHNAIEKIVRAGITTGCAAGRYCPGDAITRDAMAVFILRGEHGGSYNPPAATGTVFEDVKTTTFLSKWMEQFGKEGITTGCGAGTTLPNYCPTGLVTRDGMSVFLERGKRGSSFNPPAATGNVFCDVLATTFLSKWMEQLKADNITQGCGSGPCPRLGGTTPTFCPLGTVTRGEMAPFIVRAFGL
jgi:hypothetical protein